MTISPKPSGGNPMLVGICSDPLTIRALPRPYPFDFIEGHIQAFLLPEAPDRDFAPHAEALRASGLTMPAANCLFPADLKVVGPSVDLDRFDRYAATVMRRAGEIGMRYLVFGSAGARMVPEGFSPTRAFAQYVEALRRMAPVAQRHGVTIVVEPLNRGECNLINTIVEGAEAAAQADHPAVKLLVDIFHMLRNGESPDDIVTVGPWVRHAHIAENVDRAAPGVAGEDFRPFLRALHRIGYGSLLTIECNWGKLGLAGEVGPAVAALRRQLAEAGYASPR
jgi:sugar phosphate isomerase/epimerase